MVNHNGGRYLGRCLRALAAQTVRPRQTIVIDNASTDGSIDSLPEHFPWLHIIHCTENLGFAAANNLAVARGEPTEWLALLNPDAFPAPDWLAALQRATRDYPQYAVFGSRLLDAADPERLDGAGDCYHVSGLAWRRWHGGSATEHGLRVEEVFAPCAAAALYRRRVFREVDGFDERFFCYMEDVDLGFRMRLLGYRCLYVPMAVVHHVGSGITGIRGEFATYHGHRNLIWTYVKNMPSPWFWLYLPAHLALNLLSIAWLGWRGQGRVALRAKVDALRELPQIWRQRQGIQKKRRVAGRELRRAMTTGWAALARFTGLRGAS
ncbi:MAG: glycosyltransferase family 2 protein [Candidatus Contendobacter sp.]|nr:glycosyltransferase family 2 protein [Candidatus Contendobacter sp.]